MATAASAPIPTLSPLKYTTTHRSKLYLYATKFPKTWSLDAGTEPNLPDTIPDLGTGRSDFYSDGVNDGVMVTSAPVSQTNPDLATWSAFIKNQVAGQYGAYIGINNCTEPTRTLTIGGEPANEVDFVCPGRSWLWATTVHDGQAYQVAWLDDNGYDPTYLRPFFDQFLTTFTFTQ